MTLRAVVGRAVRTLTPSRGRAFSRASRRVPALSADAPTTEYPVERLGLPAMSYRPRADGLPDPGEVVWAWVPYEEDASRGKDRPVLVIARDGRRLVGLMLTSQDHDRDAAREARWGRSWLDIGTGGWDRQRRPSEVRLDRLLSLPVDGVRREGAALAAPVFSQVAQALRELHGA
jgi:hypothetical protein